MELSVEGDLDERLRDARVAAALFGPQASAAVRLGRFELLEVLGRGSMGTVYAALDGERGATVALKLLTRTEPNGVYRIKREFRSISQLVHPNLVTPHELFHDQGHWFFSMELVRGVRFDEWVVGVEPGLKESRLRSATLQLARAVEEIHRAGKLHCDLKPSNVLVTAEGRVRVLDFGLVSEAPSGAELQSSHAAIAGTPAYMAPEQAAGQPPSTASDWYAVGVMLFDALTGRLPFAGPPLLALSEKQRQAAPDPRVLGGWPYEALCTLCDRLLAREPGERWDAPRVLAWLADDQAPATAAATHRSALPDAPAPPPFVGREAELEQLRSALRSIDEEGATALLVDGPSGVGKSALLERFAAEIPCDTLVLRGRCHEYESVPHKVFDTVVDGLAVYLRKQPVDSLQQLLPRHVDALLQLLPALGRVETFQRAATASARVSQRAPRELRTRAFAALKELLLRLTDRTRVVLLVDDLQWGDLDSARMIAHVLGPPEPPPLLLIGAYRSDERARSPFLAELLDPSAMGAGWRPRCLALAPLPFASAVECARALLSREGVVEQGLAAELAAESKGLPVFIDELVRHVRASGAQPFEAIRTGRASLDQLILARAAALPEPARAALNVLGVAAGPLERSIVLDAAGLTVEGHAALAQLRAARLLRTRAGAGDETLEIYHDRIRETLVGGLNPECVAELHARIADALGRGAVVDPERLFVHHLGAGNRARAAATAVAAAHASAHELAFNRAADLYAQAIELSDEPAIRSELYGHLGEALVNAGRSAPAAEALLKGVDGADPSSALRLRCRAAQQYLRCGRTKLGLALAKQVLSEVGILRTQSILLQIAVHHLASLFRPRRFVARDQAQVPQDARTKIEVCRSLCREMCMAQPVAGTHLRALLIRLAHETGDAAALLDGLAWEAIQSAAQGGPLGRRRCKTALAKLAPVVDSIGTPEARALHQLTLSHALVYQARFAEAVVPARAGIEAFALLAARGMFWEENSLATIYYMSLNIMGEIGPIALEAQARRHEACEHDDMAAATLLLSTECLGCLAADRADDALELLRRQDALLEPDVFSDLHLSMLFGIVDSLLYCGRPLEALAYVEQVWPTFHRSPLRLCQFGRTMANYCRARALVAVAAQEPTRARLQRAQVSVRALGREDTHHARSLHRMLSAALHHIRGEDGRAARLLDAAEQSFTAAGEMLYATAARAQRALINGEPEPLQAAHEAIRIAGVARPEAWARTWAPGFGRRARPSAMVET